MEQQYDRSAEDIGNSIMLEHVNTTVPDQTLAMLFYAVGLGLTRDPYLFPSVENMWMNVGYSQFHLPTRAPQVVRGHTAIVIPNREQLLKRLAAVKDKLAGTRFAVEEKDGYVDAICPWGNRIRCFEPDVKRFGRIKLGMPYIELDVPVGAADPIARFYKEVIGCNVVLEDAGRCARVQVGNKQFLLFRETANPIPEYDGHHIQIYIADFSGPHRWLKEHGLITQESDQFQYRFVDISDPQTGKPVFKLEHEVRSLTHPLYRRHLVNRNAAQTTRPYSPGYDADIPELA